MTRALGFDIDDGSLARQTARVVVGLLIAGDDGALDAALKAFERLVERFSGAGRGDQIDSQTPRAASHARLAAAISSLSSLLLQDNGSDLFRSMVVVVMIVVGMGKIVPVRMGVLGVFRW